HLDDSQVRFRGQVIAPDGSKALDVECQGPAGEIVALAEEGVKRIAVFNPGFVSDCLETLEEIAGEAAEEFEEHGGEKFTHIPCLNDSEIGMDLIETVVRRETCGWVD
ncbi:MAG: ferrochelatase, partial [Pseudomonadota bacterium]